MPITTIDYRTSTTANTTGDADNQWMELDNTLLYYDPGFKKACFEKLTELEALRTGWDSHGAPSINRQVIEVVRHLIASLPEHIAIRPMVVPLSSGNVQLEWHHGRQVLELEFETPESVHYLKWDPDNQIEVEDLVPASDMGQLVSLIQWFMKGMLDE